MAGSNDKSDNSCKKCTGKDTNEMVQCDACDQWYHFVCVGVDHNVANESWSCEYCRGASSVTGGHVTHSSTPTTTSVPQAHVSERAINNIRPYPITTALTPPVSYSSVPQPMIYSAPIMSNLPPITWQNCYFPTTQSLTQQNAPTNYFRVTTQIPSQTTFANTNIQHYDGISWQRNIELQKLEEEMHIKRQQLDAKYKMLSQTSELSTSYTSSAGPMLAPPIYAGPTAAQLNARQSIPKQLPTFNGDPDDWPLFISSFENSTSVAGYTDSENLIRLQSSLKGKAREMVRDKLLAPQMVPEIIRTLRMCFGRPEYIIERAISKAKSMPPIKDKLDSLIEYAMCVRNICATMESCQMQSYLNNPLLVKELIDKLPNNQSWAMCLKDERIPCVKLFSDWLFHMAEAACSVTPLFGKGGSSVYSHNRDEGSTAPRISNVKNAVSTTCIVCSDCNHKVDQCEVFKNMPLNQKWECVKTKNICRQCLGRHRRKCNIDKNCGIDGCTYKHNPLLHRKVNGAQYKTQNDKHNSIVNAHSNNYDESQLLFRILPVNIHTPNKITKVFAFLDEGSAVTLIEKSTFDALGLQGESDPLCLRWTGDTTRMETDSVKTNITISSALNNKKFQLNAVHTVTNLGLSGQTIDIGEISKRFPYLAKLPIQSYYNAIPTILIGSDNWKVAIPLKIREGDLCQARIYANILHAIKYRLLNVYFN